jgi:hypothetical protein
MTATELAKYINREGDWQTGELRVRVKIVDVKKAYGRLDYRITPIAGSGEQWINGEAVKLDKNGK